MKSFGDTAVSLSKNPLGVIALFIVLVYGFAAIVTVVPSALTPSERYPLIYFLILFPVLVFVVFVWLVKDHSGKLFAPSDYRDDETYLKIQATASLVAANYKSPHSGEPDIEAIVGVIQGLGKSGTEIAKGRHNCVLWVDDRPENNVYERQALEALGLDFTLSLNTTDALLQLSSQKFSVVISDMGRKEGPREGYALLDAMRAKRDSTPLIFYASSNAPEHVLETKKHGGQGCTNDPNQLIKMVINAVLGKEPR